MLVDATIGCVTTNTNTTNNNRYVIEQHINILGACGDQIKAVLEEQTLARLAQIPVPRSDEGAEQCDE